MPEGPQSTRTPWPVPRRSLILGLGLGAVAGLSACSEDGDDPRSGRTGGIDVSEPLDTPVPDVDVLTATRLGTRALVHACDASTPEQSERAALRATRRVLDVQYTVLTSLLRAGGVDLGGEGGDGDAKDATATAGPGESDISAVIDLLLEQSLGDTARADMGSVSGINLPTLMALHSQRTASAALLGEPVSWPSLKGPTGAGTITMLAGLRQAIYGLEVVAAQATGAERETYRDAISSLRGPTRTLTDLAGPTAPAPPLGYGRPSDLSTQGRRTKLAQALMLALPQALIAGSAARAFDDSAIYGTIQVMSTAVRVGSSLGVPLAAFPGLTIPETP